MTEMVVKDEAQPVSPATAVQSSPSPLQHFSLMPISPSSAALSTGAPYQLYPHPPWLLTELSSADRGLILIHLLVNCCTHVAARNLEPANALLDHISVLASPDGDTMQRVASYFTDALACRLLRSCSPGVYRALHSTRVPVASPAEAMLARRRFFLELCPFLRLAAVVANRAVVEAMEGEKVVHVVDLHAWDPAQWVALMHVLAARPCGPPHLRITGVHESKEVLDHTAARLTEEAERLDVPFQFHPVVSRLEDLNADAIRVKTGEAVAVCSLLQLHTLLSSDVAGGESAADGGQHLGGMAKKTSPTAQARLGATLGDLLDKDQQHQLLLSLSKNGFSSRRMSSPPGDGTASGAANGSSKRKAESFLEMLWGLSPKIMVVAEQESDHNRPALGERFTEALNYYAALFDCLESSLPPSLSSERARVERLVLGEEIRNIIACEGGERKERHERLARWAVRLDAAGFAPVPLSFDAMYQARALLQQQLGCRCDGYRVREDGGCFQLCWHNHPLYSLSAWRCRRFD